MRKLTLLFMIATLLVIAMAPPPAQAADDPSFYFVGGRIDYKPDKQLKWTFGTAIPLGKGLWTFPHGDVGQVDSLGGKTSSVDVDFGYALLSGKTGAFHILLAPSIDWVQRAEGASIGTYLGGAAGVMGVLHLSSILPDKGGVIGILHDKVSLWAAYRYETNFKSETAYSAGNLIGFGAAVRQ